MSRALLVAVAVFPSLVEAQGLQALYERHVSTNPNLRAMSVMTSSQGTVQWGGSSGTFGSRSRNSDQMGIDSAVRIGSVAEMVVVAAALKAPAIYRRLNQPVPSKFIPHGLPLTNPLYPSEGITYRHLMQHTSSLTDNGPNPYRSKIVTPTCSVSSGTFSCSEGVDDFVAWMESVFESTSTSGNPALSGDIFIEKMPGLTDTYHFAHINTALLVYIMNRMASDSTLDRDERLVTTRNTAASWIYEQVLQPLGMSSTFVLRPNGQLPQTDNQALSALLQSMVLDYTTAGNQQFILHPNKDADVMTFSTAGDLMRFATKVLGTPDPSCPSTTDELCHIGRIMRSDYTITVGDTARTFQTQQGLGVQFYDPSEICRRTTDTGIYTKCPLRDSHDVWGYMTGGSDTDITSIAGVLCTDASGSTSTVPASCTVVLQGYDGDVGTPLSPLSAFAVAGAAFQDTFGETTVVATSGGSGDDDLYGLWVCLGVVMTIAFVVAASYFTEFLIQRTPPVGPRPFRPGQPPAEQMHPVGAY